MTTLFETIQKQIDDQAQQVDRNFRVQRKQVIADFRLSEQGKREKLVALEQDRVTKISALQEKAHAELADGRKRHATKMEAAHKAQEEKRRAVLGDTAMLQLLDRRLRRLTGRDVVQFVKDSASEWQRAIVTELAQEILDERLAGGVLVGDEQGYQLNMAYADLQALVTADKPADLADLERQGFDLRRGDEWIESLDADAARRRMANVGINYEGALLYADERDKQAQA